MESVKEVVLTSSNTPNLKWTTWDYTTGCPIASYKKLDTSCDQIHPFNDTHLLATDSKSPYLHLLSRNDENPRRLVTQGVISALTSTSDGSYVVLGIGEKIFIYQSSTGKLLKILSRHFQSITSLTFNSDNSNFCSGGEDALVLMWCLADIFNNTSTETQPKYEFSEHTLAVTGIFFGKFGLSSYLTSISLDKSARIYNASVGVPIITLLFDYAPTAVCMDNNESNLFIGFVNGELKQLNLQAIHNQHRESYIPVCKDCRFIRDGHSSRIKSLDVSVDGRTLLSSSLDGILNLWNISSQQIIKTIHFKGPITNAMFVLNNSSDCKFKYKSPIRLFDRQSTTKQEIIEVFTAKNSDDFLFDENLFFEKKCGNANSSKITNSLKSENEKLKKSNYDLYKYGVDYLFINEK